MSKKNILVIDDEPQIRNLLQITLESNDYRVYQASTARDGLRYAVSSPPDLILLDLGLPDDHGIVVLNKLRQWYTEPIIIISVQSGEEGIAQALDTGANDYIIKPFRTIELLARIRSALRSGLTKHASAPIKSKNLVIDLHNHVVKKNTELIKLTSTEYSLLEMFAKNAGKVLTHRHLLNSLWGPGFVEQSQYLRVYVAQLRKKIEDDPNRPMFITTESGVGYRFISDDE